MKPWAAYESDSAEFWEASASFVKRPLPWCAGWVAVLSDSSALTDWPSSRAFSGSAPQRQGPHVEAAAKLLQALAPLADGPLEGVRLLLVHQPVIQPVQADVVTGGHRAP